MMKKLLLILSFIISLYGNEELLYEGEGVKYFCVNGIVKADITFTNGTKDLVKVVWVNPKQNNETTLLDCEDFDFWIKDTEQY